jgi:diguanylate cyclase (GGDEF)-like protein
MKFPPNLEADYQSDLGPEKIRVLKLTAKLGCALYLSFGILDYWAIPSACHQVWIVRGSTVALTLIVFAVATYRPKAVLSRYAFVVWTMQLIWAFGIAVMIVLAKQSDLAWSSYYCGLMLVCSATPVGYLGVRLTYALGITCVAIYIAVAVCVQGMATGQEWPRLLMNAYFLVSAMIIGIVIATISDRYSRQVYLLRLALRRDMEVAKEAKLQSDFLAEHDTLTELPNRIFFLRQLEQVINRAADAGTTVSVLFIDLDGFKPINDLHGHAVGDMVLRVVARRIRACVRAVDLVARYGGDEFVVAVEFDQQHMSSVERLRRNLKKTIADLIGIDANELSVTASVGTAIYPFDTHDAAELIRAADQRMYEAKRKSKARSSPAMPGIVIEDSSSSGNVSQRAPI